MAFEMKALWFHVLGFDAAKIPNKRKRQVVDFVLLFTNASEINLDTKSPDRLPPPVLYFIAVYPMAPSA